MVISLPLDSFHTACFEVDSGYGLLLCPDAAGDVRLGRASVHGAAWAETLARLAGLGWQPRRDASGRLRHVGRAEGGQVVVEAEAVGGSTGVGEDDWRALCEAAGLLPDGPCPRA